MFNWWGVETLQCNVSTSLFISKYLRFFSDCSDIVRRDVALQRLYIALFIIHYKIPKIKTIYYFIKKRNT